MEAHRTGSGLGLPVPWRWPKQPGVPLASSVWRLLTWVGPGLAPRGLWCLSPLLCLHL